METGSLWVAATLAGKAGPQPGVRVTVFDEAGLVVFRQETDAEGVARVGALPAPDPALSLEPNPAARPYAVYSLLAECEGWQPLRMFGIQLFAGQRTVARIALLPAAAALDTATLRAESEITIPPHPLYAGGGGSGPAPAAGARVLGAVVIPRSITVHLGRPAENARNVTVRFQDYIANVASSEVYPTWEGYRNSQKARQSIISLPSIRQLSHSPTKNRIIDPYRAIALPPGPLSQKCRPRRYCLVLSPPISF